MNNIQAVTDYVYFVVDKEKEDTIDSKVGTLYLNPDFEHGLHHRIYGTVVSVPQKLSNNNLAFFKDDPGKPYPKDYLKGVGIWVTMSDIDPIIRKGDRIYYHFNAISEDNRLKGYFEDTKSKTFRVGYDQIFCVVREGEIIPVGGHVLVEKVFDPGVEEIEVKGVKVMAKTSASGLVTEVGSKPVSYAGTIAYIGAPFKCDPDLGLVAGDKIVFTKESDWVNKIEGKEYYVMRQRDIIAKYEQ